MIQIFEIILILQHYFCFFAIINIWNSFVYLNILMISWPTMILFDNSKKLKKKFSNFLIKNLIFNL